MRLGGKLASNALSGGRMMQKPILQAMVLADQVYQDVVTGKFVIAGTFGRIHVHNNHPHQVEQAAKTKKSRCRANTFKTAARLTST